MQCVRTGSVLAGLGGILGIYSRIHQTFTILIGHGSTSADPRVPSFLVAKIVAKIGVSTEMTVRTYGSTCISCAQEWMACFLLGEPCSPGSSQSCLEIVSARPDSSFGFVDRSARRRIPVRLFLDSFTEPSSKCLNW